MDGKLNRILESLNSVQREAVTAPEMPVLVLAGAGSGKTRVLTNRIAYLILEYKVPPENILAVTFTNKAANEMKERLTSLLGPKVNRLWVGTFHSIFARILRRECAYIGYGRNYAIYDSDDQLRAIKSIMETLHISTKDVRPEFVRAKISRLKNELISPEDLRNRPMDRVDETVFKVYQNYVGFLKANNAMDFDDLITLPVKLFRENPQVLEFYQNLFRHILVDEYQDTNAAQNELVILLGRNHRNVFVVGDDDQSIYRWRGAEIKHILNFEKVFQECKIFRLEQNYRSTKTILEAAHSVVSNNRMRKEKKLWTERENGEPLVLLEAIDANDEARKIVNRIQYEIMHHKRNFRDFVILYRTNAQSRALEDALRRNGISYIIVGGTRFYERKEIKDFLAYLKVIDNPNDSVSLKRILNFPPRGIGNVTLSRLEDFAALHEIPLYEAILRAHEIDDLSPRQNRQIRAVGDLFEKYRALVHELSLNELVRVLNDEVGFLRYYKEEGTDDAMNRYDNIMELLSAISEFCQTREEPTLERFLEEVSLITDIDSWNDKSNAVTLMTVHSAKGLEFPVVFLSGLEDGLFPLIRDFENQEEIEEERRLFYVGLTRAQDKIYLSWAQERRKYGGDAWYNRLSRFVDEIDETYIDVLIPRTTRKKDVDKRPRYQKVFPDYEEIPQTPDLYIGCEVDHEKFGHGVITNMEGHGQNLKITVAFEEAGVKKLLYQYAQHQLKIL